MGVASTASREESHTGVVAARPLKASPPPTADGVDKMYRQLAEIHAIVVVNLAECVRWRWSNPTLTRLTLALVSKDPPRSPPQR
jgi:hypothetical protein